MGHALTAERAAIAAAHGVGCLIARAVGRSQLEYLDASEKIAVLRIAYALTRRHLPTPEELVESFASALCP